MHIGRVARQLADLFALHGHQADIEATVTGRTRTSYRIPLVVRPGPTGSGGQPVLVDGDLESSTVDDGAVLRLYLACVDTGTRALYVHTGAATAAAHEAGGDRVLLWSKDDVVSLLGLTQWNAALGLPLPTLPIPAPSGHLAPAPMLSQATSHRAVGEPPATVAPPPQAVVEPAPEEQPLADPGEPEPLPPPPASLTPEAYIDLDPAPGPTVDLETGEEVEVTTLPTDEADELATAEPLQAGEPHPAGEPLPPQATGHAATSVDEALPVAFKVPKKAAEGPSGPAAPPSSAELPLFQLPPAFRPDSDGGAGAALPVPEGSNGLLPATLTLGEARALVADRLFGIEEWELILQPVHLFDYTVELLKEGSLEVDAQRGRIQVNGTDRRVTVCDPVSCDPAVPARVTASPDLTIMDKVLRVSPERAEQVARAWATETHGKSVHVPMSGADDSFDLTERRTVEPTSGQVLLKPLGIWHRPFWRLWGSNGHVDLDAVEGQLLDEEIKAPNPDFLVVE